MCKSPSDVAHLNYFPSPWNYVLIIQSRKWKAVNSTGANKVGEQETHVVLHLCCNDLFRDFVPQKP